MWTDLFVQNSDNLVNEIDLLIENLTKYADALRNDNKDELKQLLKNGRETKKQAG